MPALEKGSLLMQLGQLFPFVIAALCAVAALVYAFIGDYRNAVIWGAFSVADFAVAV